MPYYVGTRDYPYITEGKYVYFKGEWTDFTSDSVFKVTFSEKFPVVYAYILKPDQYVSLNLNEDLNLYPDSLYTLYELGIGIEGQGLLYVMLPANRYFFSLEKAGQMPASDPTSQVSTMYIGAFSEKDIPVVEPKMLREYTVRNYESIVYILLNDTPVDQKIRLHVTVNRLKIEKVDIDPEKLLEERPEDVVVLESYKLATWKRE